MHEEWTDKLSEYLDDELSPGERAAVDMHLRGCAECAEVLNDLKRVVARARAADTRPPHADLWPEIAERTESRRAGGWRVSFTLPQAMAASLVIALLSGAVVWRIVGRPEGSRDKQQGAVAGAAQGFSPASDQGSGPAAERATPSTGVVPVSFADAQYDAAVADLERALRDGRGRLDKTTVAIVEHNLQLIDQAIQQAREALESDPANDYLSSHLVEARRRKLDLLRRAAELTESD